MSDKTLDEHNEAVKRARLARGRGLSPHGFADALDITDAAYDAEHEARVKAEDKRDYLREARDNWENDYDRVLVKLRELGGDDE